MRGTRSGTGRHIPPGYVVRPGIIPKSHFLIGGYTSTDENLRGVEPKNAGGPRAQYILYGLPSLQMLRGELASLASAVPRAAAALPPSSYDDPWPPPRVSARSAVEILKDTNTLAGSHVVFRFLSRRLRIETASSARCSSRPSSLLGDHRAFKRLVSPGFTTFFLAQPTSYASGTPTAYISARHTRLRMLRAPRFEALGSEVVMSVDHPDHQRTARRRPRECVTLRAKQLV